MLQKVNHHWLLNIPYTSQRSAPIGSGNPSHIPEKHRSTLLAIFSIPPICLGVFCRLLVGLEKCSTLETPDRCCFSWEIHCFHPDDRKPLQFARSVGHRSPLCRY
uniref:(northern house mosquito) hypothetical protein n=1 Tax=Culex pipiens TaxID=7175 RepID=A0A8D8FZ75_CULPI